MTAGVGGGVVGRHLGDVAHDQKVGRSRILRCGGVPDVLDIGADCRGGGSRLSGGGHYHVETFPRFPFHKRLQGGNEAFRGDDQITHRIAVEGCPLRAGVEQGALEHALKSGGVGAGFQLFGGRVVGSCKTDFHFSLVDHFRLSGGGIVTHRNKIQGEKPFSAHISEFGHANRRVVRPGVAVVKVAFHDKGNCGWIDAFGYRFLTRKDRVGNAVGIQIETAGLPLVEGGCNLSANRDADDLPKQGQPGITCLVGAGIAIHPQVGENAFRRFNLFIIKLLDVVANAKSIHGVSQQVRRGWRVAQVDRALHGGQ